MNISNEIFLVNEIFQSIQGEGNCSGINSLFIRFHFCNLTCSWCDTKYTWLGNHNQEMVYSKDELKKVISGSTTTNIIFTGGEPAIYQLDELVVPGKRFHVETNGTIIPEESFKSEFKSVVIEREAMSPQIIEKFNWVVSPKLSNSRQVINEKALEYWSKSGFCVFKFIIHNLSDIDEVEEVQQRFGIDKNIVFIGLEGQTLESQLRPELVDEIVKRGFNFSPRLHVMLWGNKRMK